MFRFFCVEQSQTVRCWCEESPEQNRSSHVRPDTLPISHSQTCHLTSTLMRRRTHCLTTHMLPTHENTEYLPAILAVVPQSLQKQAPWRTVHRLPEALCSAHCCTQFAQFCILSQNPNCSQELGQWSRRVAWERESAWWIICWYARQFAKTHSKRQGRLWKKHKLTITTRQSQNNLQWIKQGVGLWSSTLLFKQLLKTLLADS